MDLFWWQLGRIKIKKVQNSHLTFLCDVLFDVLLLPFLLVSTARFV